MFDIESLDLGEWFADEVIGAGGARLTSLERAPFLDVVEIQ